MNKQRLTSQCLQHPLTMEIRSPTKFVVSGKTYTLKKIIASGEFGITLSAICKQNKIAVKAILPTLEKPYQVQEIENQYYLDCMFDELRTLESAARFPNTYFLAKYEDSHDDYLQLMYDHDITDTPVIGMEYLQDNLAHTLLRLYEAGNTTEIAKLAKDALFAVATTLKEVNRQLSFVHGDLHVGNIMHQNGTFYIIDFGATRLANGRQLALEPGGYYSKEIGSSGLDLLLLSLSLADWCDTPLPNLLEMWYPLWKFYKTSPVGRYDDFHAHQNSYTAHGMSDINIVVDHPYENFLNPLGPCFLGTGYKTECEWPLGDQVDDDPTRIETWHYYGYGAGDNDPNVEPIFEPSVFLSGSPEEDEEFMQVFSSLGSEPGLLRNVVSAIAGFFTFNEQPQFHTYVCNINTNKI